MKKKDGFQTDLKKIASLRLLSEYLLLVERLVTGVAEFAGMRNFGQEEADTKPVPWILDRLC